jgi:hypothetical protein
MNIRVLFAGIMIAIVLLFLGYPLETLSSIVGVLLLILVDSIFGRVLQKITLKGIGGLVKSSDDGYDSY